MKPQYDKKSYTEHFRRITPDLLVSNKNSRTTKAQKIHAILNFAMGNEERIKNSRCLDLGCSEGHISNYFGEYFGKVIGIDTDRPALKIAVGEQTKSPAFFVCGSGLELPFKPETFDIIICNQIYEHVPDPQKMMEEIRRVLKMDGICFFGAGNRFKVIEGHYFLPFLSWLPPSLADLYLRLTGKGEHYEEQHFSYFGIRKLIKDFNVYDYTIDVIKAPYQFSFNDATTAIKIASWVPRWILKIFLPLSPNYLYILRQKDQNPERFKKDLLSKN